MSKKRRREVELQLPIYSWPRESKLEAIYAQLPKLKCIGKCQDACGPIPLAPIEQERFEAEGLAVPDYIEMLKTGHLSCQYLGPLGNCTIYAQRPLICRLYGSVPGMQCEHGCKPDLWLSDDEAQSLLNELEQL